MITLNNPKLFYEFNDTVHRAVLFGDLCVRVLDNNNKSTLNREFLVQKLLAPTGFVPKTYFRFVPKTSFIPALMLEERLFPLDLKKGKSEFIKNVGFALKTVHDFSRNNKEIVCAITPKNLFLDNGKYEPNKVFSFFIGSKIESLKRSRRKLVNDVVETTISEISDRIKIFSEKINYRAEFCSLIHGDFNPTNIMQNKKGGLAFIDWGGSRWDIPSCDLAQFIYFNNLDSLEEELFIKNYNCSWLNRDMIEINKLLLIGWDMVYLINANLEIAKSKNPCLPFLKKVIWEANQSPLSKWTV